MKKFMKNKGVLLTGAAVLLMLCLFLVVTKVGIAGGQSARGAAEATQKAADGSAEEQAGSTEQTVSQSAGDATEGTTEASTAVQTSDSSGICSNPLQADSRQQEASATKKVYLTFDDGPSTNTSRLLDVLDQYQVKATFFDVCNTRDRDVANMKRVVESGHTLGIHSVTHVYSQVYASLSSFESDVLDMQQYLYDTTGYRTWYYRFPGGSSNAQAAKYGTDIQDCIDFLNNSGFRYYDWNVSSQDAVSKLSADQVAANVINGVGSADTAIVLLHDTNSTGTTVDALPTIITTLQSEGYTLLPITENTKPVHHRE